MPERRIRFCGVRIEVYGRLRVLQGFGVNVMSVAIRSPNPIHSPRFAQSRVCGCKVRVQLDCSLKVRYGLCCYRRLFMENVAATKVFVICLGIDAAFELEP